MQRGQHTCNSWALSGPALAWLLAMARSLRCTPALSRADTGASFAKPWSASTRSIISLLQRIKLLLVEMQGRQGRGLHCSALHGRAVIREDELLLDWNRKPNCMAGSRSENESVLTSTAGGISGIWQWRWVMGTTSIGSPVLLA